MEEQKETGRPDGTREWLLQLERRVSELERAQRDVLTRRRRGFLYLALAGVVYLVFMYWMTNLV